MAKLKVYQFPDLVLKKKASPIDRVEKSHRKLADDMLETMYSSPGVGLAANQVGILDRILVLDTDYSLEDLEEGEELPETGEVVTGRIITNQKPKIIINPEIVHREGKILYNEGCLSVPEYQAEVERAEKIKLQYQDIDGLTQTMDAEGLMAVCIQHEIDHLDGKLFIDRLSVMKRDMVKKKLLKARKEREEEEAVSKLKAVFMGTPEFSVPTLKALAENHTIVAVYTQPDRPVGRGMKLKPPPVKVAAEELGLSVFQPKALKPPEEVDRLRDFDSDVIVVAAYAHILRKEVLDLPRLGCINIHSSLLPRWRGAAPIQSAILAGDRESGVCTMKMAEKLDAGDVYLMEKTSLSDRETVGSLHDRLSEMAAPLILRTLEGVAADTLQASPQDESQVTFSKKLTKDMQWLDPELSAIDIDRRVRALNPWPGTSVNLGELGRLRILEVEGVTTNRAGGTRIFEEVGELYLGAKDGALKIVRLQWEGKKPIDSKSFLNGLSGRGVALPLRWVSPNWPTSGG